MISKMTFQEIDIIETKITKPIMFISENLIPENVWLLAEDLTKDIDDKDIPYVAFSLFYNCDIWSGDKALRKGLESKGFKRIISTEELFELREKKERR